jgi:phosphate:Na+ symporter
MVLTHMIFYTFGGLGLFLYGMGLMSEGLKKAAGQKLRKLLESMTGNPVMGLTMGFVVTGIIQSSSATTVMLIGLVNAGLMTLRQAIPVIFGANIGTTVTAWIVSLTGLNLDINNFALPMIGVGFLMDLLGKSRQVKSSGQILLGFGLLFLGIDFMKEAFTGLEQNQAVQAWLGGFGTRPIMALLAGMAITFVIQSSSASIAIIQILATSGVFGHDWMNVLNAAIPFVLGANIGTTITAQLAAIRTNVSSRRTAWAHSMFNVIGTLYFMPLVYIGWYSKFVVSVSHWELNQETVAATIAVGHTMFNLINSLAFLPFYRVLEKIVTKMIRPRAGELVDRSVVLEVHLLDTPVLALGQARREILHMTKEARESLVSAMEAIMNNDRKKIDLTRKLEELVDDYQLQITSYLVALSQRELSEEVSVELPVLLHMVNDLERVGDHAVNLVEIAERKMDHKVVFSDDAKAEAEELFKEAFGMFDHVMSALEGNNIQAAHHALVNENQLNKMQVKFRRNHVRRMADRLCSAEVGVIFIDIVDNVEKIGDHLTNIAESVIGGIQWSGVKSNSLSGEFRALTGEKS